MARLTGGIFSRPSGNNNGLVFGAGRTRIGKKVTVREKVNPSNPNTTAQQNQRGRFAAAIQVVRSLGRLVYPFDFNRAVGELPGFHSLVSILINAMDMTGELLSPPQSVTLGVRHFPEEFSATEEDGSLTVTWSTEIGDLGAANDQADILVIQAASTGDPWDRATIVDSSETRASGSATIDISDDPNAEYIVGLFFSTDETGLQESHRRSEIQWLSVG